MGWNELLMRKQDKPSGRCRTCITMSDGTLGLQEVTRSVSRIDGCKCMKKECDMAGCGDSAFLRTRGDA